MASVDVLSRDNKKISDHVLPEWFVAEGLKDYLVYDVVKMQLANRRQGTASTKGRSDVRGGGKKPFRQKGTGRARQGTSRSPICVGGGTIFGPKPRSYSIKVNKKATRRALQSVLISHQLNGELRVVDDLSWSEVKTKSVSVFLEGLDVRRALLVDEDNMNLALSCRNLKNVKYCRAQDVNVYDCVKYQYMVISKTSFEKLLELAS